MKLLDSLKRSIRRFAPSLWVCIKGNKFLFSSDSYLNKVGFIESIRKEKPCEADGSPLPWMNYGIISLLKNRLSKEQFLFEYGSGSSTLFWAKRVGGVVAVEHDENWYREVEMDLPATVELKYRPMGDIDSYINSIAESDSDFDIVVVDGIERTKCLMAASKKLSPTGVIIFDDSDREEWFDGVNHLQKLGFKQLKISGLKPTGFGVDETSIFYRDNNCLGI
jgi:precorrin-6B methylase 2